MRSHRRAVEPLQAVAPTCSLSFVDSPVYADDSLIGAPGPGWLDKGFRERSATGRNSGAGFRA
jgi:hypothetical protein